MNKNFIACLIASAFISACSVTSPSGIAISNVTVIDAANGSRANQTVIFESDKIIAVQDASAKVNAKQIIDGTGKYLIPGLWDFHVHLSYDKHFTRTMSDLFLSYGITSVRDTGGLLRKMLPIVNTMRSAQAIAPRVFFSGPLLDGNFVVYDGDSRPEIGVRNATPKEARQMIVDLDSQGIDFIKIYELVSPPVFQAMVDTAKNLNIPIDSHVPLSMRASTAGPLVNSMEHLRNVETDCASNADQLHTERLALLENADRLSGYQLRSAIHKLQRLPAIANYSQTRCDETLKALTSTTQVPTLRLNTINAYPPFLRKDWQQAVNRSPIEIQKEWRKMASTLEENLENADKTFADWSLFLTERMYSKGIPIAAGTDTPIGLSVPGYSLHSELEMLVKAGLPPIEALRAATLRPAEYFSLQHEMGTIDPGKKADMVLLNKNPLQDISNTKSISAVISKGKLLELKTLIDRLENSGEK